MFATPADQLRQAAAMCSGSGQAVLVTRVFLLRLAGELEPDWAPPDPETQATRRSGYEAIGRNFSAISGDIPSRCQFYFIDRKSFDTETWHMVYQLGFARPRHGMPAVRPRMRVKARSISGQDLAILLFAHRERYLCEAAAFRNNFLARLVTNFLEVDPLSG